ncbi:uncharacterized protein UTRI_01569 [Ustilago trichophora]|uniref:Uncharacterized protein n=1 Tax=Ustilago trichophora TaxID=86804 RepID=A0A5C3E013_9BASI|nr:uncharacterized protein UTRI_01569 [Ustilago trichophora]
MAHQQSQNARPRFAWVEAPIARNQDAVYALSSSAQVQNIAKRRRRGGHELRASLLVFSFVFNGAEAVIGPVSQRRAAFEASVRGWSGRRSEASRTVGYWAAPMSSGYRAQMVAAKAQRPLPHCIGLV